MQLVPTFTESGGHLSVPATTGTAAARQTAAQPTTMYLRIPFMVTCPLSCDPASRSLGRRASGVRCDDTSRALREGSGKCIRVTYLTVKLYFCVRFYPTPS